MLAIFLQNSRHFLTDPQQTLTIYEVSNWVLSLDNYYYELNTILLDLGLVIQWVLKVKTSYGHAIALWKKRCGIDQKRLII